MALQILYRMDLNPCDPEEALKELTRQGKSDPSAEKFAGELVLGAVSNREEIDGLITRASLKWGLGRMAVVDRNVLRLATYELLASPDTPARVVLNEAIELSKSFGGEESSTFVNGVLDRIRADLGREA